MIGATLDRNGLRPGRWLETKDGWVVLGSETGVMDEAPENIARRGRLQPGKLFLVDLEQGRIVADGEVKDARSRGRSPYGRWYAQGVVHLADLPDARAARAARGAAARAPARVRLQPGGPAGAARRRPRVAAQEPIGSMGNDIALAVLSRQASRRCSPTSSSSSRRSRTRRSTRSARTS